MTTLSIMVYTDGQVVTHNWDENDRCPHWTSFFVINHDLGYLEFRDEEGKKTREYTRIGWYKHLAGEVK